VHIDSHEQTDELGAALAHARRADFYRERIPPASGTAAEWLARVPLTHRRDLMTAAPFARLAVPRADLWQYVESSGTTGSGTLTAGYTRDDMARSVAGLTPDFLALFDEGRTVLNRFPYPLAAVSSTLEWLARERGACIVPAGNLSWLVPFERALDLIRRVQPDVVAALPLELVILGALADHLGIPRRECVGSIDAIIAGGGPLPPNLARLLEADWGARVVELYGSTETLALGSGCRLGRLHIATQNFVVEVLDPRRWTPVRSGEAGAIVLTSLHLRAMPLVRYVNEDVGQLDTTPCPCGVPQPTLKLLGRIGDEIELHGRTVYATDILDAAYRFAAAHDSRVLLAIVHQRGVRVRVEVSEPRAAMSDEALGDLRAAVNVPIDAELVERGDLLDCVSLLKVPRVYKPAPIVDWRGASRRPYTVLDALMSPPSLGFADLRRIGGRMLRTWAKKRRLLRSISRD
jgi:phenylacetate-CoA ligase